MKDSLKEWLAEHEIHYILNSHPAVYTVPEAKIHCGHISGTHCKNLFLKNKKNEQLYLVTFPQEKKLDLKKFRTSIGASKIRFADSEDLKNVLGIEPGAVSPLGLINDVKNKVVFIIDEVVWNAEVICCHPNINTETLQIPGKDFQMLIKATYTTMEIRKLPFIDENQKVI